MAQGAVGLGVAALGGGPAQGTTKGLTGCVKPLADDFVTVFESPEPKTVYTYTPGLTVAPNGRLIATLDLGGPGAAKLPGAHPVHGYLGLIFTSDDHGRTWTKRGEFAGMHARPFFAGKSLYVLGHAEDLLVMRSDDNGTTWTRPVLMTEGQTWHQSACGVHHAKGNVYLTMERRVREIEKVWPPQEYAPVLMRGKIDADLTKRENWSFASEMPFYEAAHEADLDYFGVPFYATDPVHGFDAGAGRICSPMGWLETNVVQIVDPNHYWYDPKGRTFHFFGRAHTGGTGYCALGKVVENDDGTMTTMLETVPSGRKALLLPMPGGQMRFHLLYDDPTKLYWLLSTQATDSMTRADRLPEERFNLPNNERQRLQLHFSRNCVDWCFAGIVAMGKGIRESRHYASMAVDGNDLLVLSRSGDARALDPHNGNIITFHRVKRFRELAY